MTRTVEEVAEALFDLHGWNGPSDNAGGLRNTILAALREARDAALHEAAMAVSSRRGGGTIEHMERLAAVEAIQSLASSPPPAAPARDDRGAERLVDRLVNLVRLYRGTEDLDALREEFRCVLAFVPRPSGEATALREALRECTYLLKCAASGSPALDVPRAYAAVRDAQRALAASPSRPSQPCENEFHADACDGSRQDCHPVASPSQPEKEEHHG
jgi:hypothetical protein